MLVCDICLSRLTGCASLANMQNLYGRRAHVASEFAKLGSANRVAVRIVSIGDWWEADPSSAACKMAATAIQREWGVEPLYVREGGTMPVASLIEHLLQVRGWEGVGKKQLFSVCMQGCVAASCLVRPGGEVSCDGRR